MSSLIAKFIITFKLQSDKLTDASYALSFIILIIAAALVFGFSWYVFVGTLLICAWATNRWFPCIQGH